jgi:hypothetical protein
MIDDLPASPPVRQSVHAVYLALYLILLAFFLLLNSLATIKEERVKAVIDSLSATFAVPIKDAEQESDPSSIAGEVPSDHDRRGDVARYLITAVPLARVEAFVVGGLMRLTIPTSALFEDDSARLRSEHAPLFARIALAMAADSPASDFDLELLVRSPTLPEEGADEANLTRSLATARLGAFVRTLTGRGMRQRALAAGLEHGADEIIQLSFYPRDATRARVTFAGGQP